VSSEKAVKSYWRQHAAADRRGAREIAFCAWGDGTDRSRFSNTAECSLCHANGWNRCGPRILSIYRPAILSNPSNVVSFDSRNFKTFILLNSHVSNTVASTRYSCSERSVK
jgi:hypothetical protein